MTYHILNATDAATRAAISHATHSTAVVDITTVHHRCIEGTELAIRGAVFDATIGEGRK